MKSAFARVALGVTLIIPLPVPLARTQELTSIASTDEGPGSVMTEVFSNVYARERTDLGGKWRFLPDQVQRGLRNQYPRYTLPKDEKQALDGQLVEYDWDTAPVHRQI